MATATRLLLEDDAVKKLSPFRTPYPSTFLPFLMCCGFSTSYPIAVTNFIPSPLSSKIYQSPIPTIQFIIIHMGKTKAIIHVIIFYCVKI